MEDAQRWSVTYTKHVKQKRKVYQDGFLELQSSRHKVMVYDEWDKLLESRFVKKDDVIKSGETLAFGSYLVDIGEQCGSHKPTSTLNCQEKDRKVAEKSGSLYGHNSPSNLTFIGINESLNRLDVAWSLSDLIVCRLTISSDLSDFKKSETKKCVSSPSFLDMTKTTTTEWQVLYTTQITQKAKKFHDGFVQLVVRGSQGGQVMLYDITRRHLNSRFLKKDEIVCSGESLSFEGHLVEIGEKEGDHKPVKDLTFQGRTCKAVGTAYISNIQARSPTDKKFFGGKTPENTCPEKLTDLNASSSKIGSRTPANEPRHAEWQVLYTTQITQKAKKFHDGFLQLVVNGSEGRQVMLYDITKRQLNSRFLKKDEIVCSGESLSFEGHLVEIGEQEGDHKPVIDFTFQGKNCEAVGKAYIANNQAKSPTNKKFSSGKTPDNTRQQKLADLNDSSSKIDNAKVSSRSHANEPRRAVNDILSILQKPTQRKVDSHASDVHSDIKHHMKVYAEQCNGSAQKELRESISVQDARVKILKSETVEVLNTAEKCGVSGNGRESQSRSSMFCKRSGATNCLTPIIKVECTTHNTLMSSPSSVQPHIQINPALDSEGQMPIESATFIRSSDSEEPDNPPEIISCEDITAAATYVLSSSKLPKLREDNKRSSSRCREAHPSVADTGEKTLEQNFRTKEMAEFPSFDLGF
ncbi:hypothetical protein BUALT_Bualt05G0087500 [Buddleja alternifolia]|uniref:5'-3' DNA helicase ZGRF1-like N-terminal domain-containing protein n=1 Tax=Buddleja alternifolia TaxID=168488 RepID=A0AAV6XM23_9LAMI|nr:hypothetical protein BUALT_Bualt05G0087500 [Buddleja alternifolia]